MDDISRPRSLSRITVGTNNSDAEYLDANENVTYGDSLELLDTVAETTITMNLFLNNKFDLAEERMVELADRSMYHALGYNSIVFIKAMMTCDKKELERSSEVCKQAANVIYSLRQRQSLSESILSFASKPKHMSDDELHADLCYAETLLIKAALSFFNDDNFASFIRGALNIRTCYRLYKSCEKTMNDESIWEGRDKMVRDQYESGVRAGLGMFNLMLSVLPSKVLRLLEVVGFSGDKATGLRELYISASMSHTLRSPCVVLMLLTWNLVICFMFGAGKPDLPLCHRLLPSAMSRYPKGAITLFLRARLLLVSSDVHSSIYYFNKSIESQDVYKQFHHGCYWELLFAHSYLQEWSKAANYAKLLINESKWSRSIYTYTLCIFFAADTTVEPKKREETINALANKVDGLRQRIAGKSIPMEKFCAKRAVRFTKTKSLFLAHYEFIYFWNGFDIIGSNAKLVQPILEDIERAWKIHSETADLNDKCLYLFLRAVSLRSLGQPGEAEFCLQQVIREGEAHNITDFYYLYPNAIYELALIRIADGNRPVAEEMLGQARKIKGYSLENKLHFRIHSAMETLGTRTPMM